MTPIDIIGWALALGLAWGILTSFIPLESWIASLIAAILKRREKASDAKEATRPPDAD